MRLPRDIVRELEEEAAKRNVSVSELVRAAILHYINAHGIEKRIERLEKRVERLERLVAKKKKK